MTKLNWDKLRRNDRATRPPGSSSDTIRPIAPRHEFSSGELSQLAEKGRKLLRATICPKTWIQRYKEFERQAHPWSAHPELHDVYASLQQRQSGEYNTLRTEGSLETLRLLTKSIVRLESFVSPTIWRGVNVDTFTACHEMMEQLRASLSPDQRLDLLRRIRHLVGVIGTDKLNHFLAKMASGVVLDSYTVRRWLYVAHLYAPNGQVGESLKILSARLIREMNRKR
jgi:hypothetical protein